MIDRGFQKTNQRIKSLGSESVHGLPQDWPEQKKRSMLVQVQGKRPSLLATQNVHGLPTIWDELDLSE